jgi:hypothetical protein
VTVDQLGILIGNYGNTSDGILTAEVCVDTLCATGQRDLKESNDNSTFYVPLTRDLPVEARSVIHYRLTRSGGSKPLVLWMSGVRSPAEDQQIKAPAGPLTGRGLDVKLRVKDDKAPLAKSVYADQVMNVYELNQPKPYFEELGQACRMMAEGRERVTADCSAPSTLLRRELFFPGWTAKIDGSPAPIAEYKDLFQSIALPVGKSTVVFRYEPPHMIWAWLAMLVGFAMLLLPAMNKKSQERKHQ